MEENEIIKKLGTLKEIKPSEGWISEAKKAVMAEAPVFDQFSSDLYNNTNRKSSLGFSFLHLNKLMVSVTSLVFVLFSGYFTLSASKSSLPGETLYSVKMASESVVLAVATKDDKAEVEIRQAGTRLEEMKEISKRPEDANQGEKLRQLAESFEKKVNNAQDGLAKIEDNNKKAKIAKVINVQTEKYTGDFHETKENLTDDVKNAVSERMASAVDSNKKVNFDSLTVLTGITDSNKIEIITKLNNELDKIEGELNSFDNVVVSEEESNESSTIDENTIGEDTCLVDETDEDLSFQNLNNEVKIAIEEARKGLENNDLTDAIANVTVAQELITKLQDSVVVMETEDKNKDDFGQEEDNKCDDIIVEEPIVDEEGEVKGETDENIILNEDEDEVEVEVEIEDVVNDEEKIMPVSTE